MSCLPLSSDSARPGRETLQTGILFLLGTPDTDQSGPHTPRKLESFICMKDLDGDFGQESSYMCYPVSLFGEPNLTCSWSDLHLLQQIS
jgi:predicted pyridoxine 5'-phosphate oxidase superfamily flavin-nucleotide-binding protein